MRPDIRNLKFRNQIILVFLMMFLLICVGSSIAFYNIASRQVTSDFSRAAGDAMGQIESTLETRIGIINQRAESMLINNTFSAVLTQYLNQPTSANTVAAQGIISDYLKDFERGEALIDSSYLYTSRGVFDSYVHYRKHEFDFLESPFYLAYEENDDHSVRWFGPVENLIFQNSGQVIPCVRRFTLTGFRRWQYFVFQLNQEELGKLIMGYQPFFDDIVMIDSDGNRILGRSEISDERFLQLWDSGDEVIDWKESGGCYLVETCGVTVNGWKVFGLKSKQEMLRSLGSLRHTIWKVMLLLFAVSLILILLISRHLTDALNRLAYQMTCAKEGDLSVRFFYPYKDEIGSLSESFNYMLEEIQALVRKQDESILELKKERDYIAEIEKQKRKVELKALQAQINPHFLYNTLNAITWQVADKGMKDVSLMARSLGKFFRLSLSKGAEIIPLGDEVEHVRCYMNIQGIRYQDKLEYSIDVPGEFCGYKTLKLILQPLVENAIYHGIKEKKEGGRIEVTAEKQVIDGNEVICLVVWDNGAGIPAGKLELINQGLRQGISHTQEGYGIYNVNERLRLYYGCGYGLSFESVEGEYTRAMLTIPARREVDECIKF